MYVRQAARISCVHCSAQQKCTNGKGSGCRLGMKGAMNVEAAESGARMRILNGSIRRADMGSYSGWRRKARKIDECYVH